MQEMNINALDLNLLRVFDAVMAEKNVSKAAQKLFLSQPAVSHALSRLRHTVKDDLFIKVPDGVKPTPRAMELSQVVHEALSSLERALNPQVFDPSNSRQVFRIATHDYVVTVLMAKLARYMEKHAPNASIRLKLLEGRAFDMLDRQEVDMAISAFGILPERFESSPIISDDYVCLLNEHHPLANKNMTINEFANARHLLISPRGDERGFIDSALAAEGYTRHIAMIINQFAAAPGIVASSDLVLTVPSRIAKLYADTYQLKVSKCPLSAPEGYVQTKVIWHARLGKHPAFQWLRELIQQLAEADNIEVRK
ncbi:LysR family transcriptional regulator [Glaciecola siphonariae]|uniref:LysR family transcriptional regulator n=1 Tax=Glaciecola siphonariae TaxID=521012 RepID=A0ABV9LW98_9ALTE